MRQLGNTYGNFSSIFICDVKQEFPNMMKSEIFEALKIVQFPPLYFMFLLKFKSSLKSEFSSALFPPLKSLPNSLIPLLFQYHTLLLSKVFFYRYLCVVHWKYQFRIVNVKTSLIFMKGITTEEDLGLIFTILLFSISHFFWRRWEVVVILNRTKDQ